MILKEFNFFRKKARHEQEIMGEEDFEIINQASTPVKHESFDKIEEVQEVEVQDSKSNTEQVNNLRKLSSSSKLDWSDNETIVSDFSEPSNSRHLSSPKKKMNRNNHYTVSQSFKVPLSEKNEDNVVARSLPSCRQNSKSCLINRFLKNVTMKKMMDAKSYVKERSTRKIMNLYIKGVKPSNLKDELDNELAKEIENARQKQQRYEDTLDKKMIIQFRKEIFRSRLERLARVSTYNNLVHLNRNILLHNTFSYFD